MKTLLIMMSICAVLIIGCNKKEDGKGKEINGIQNNETIQEMNKVNADLEKIRTRDIHDGDPESLNKMSAALRESREKINDLESRIDAARQGDMAEQKSGDMVRSTGERMAQVERSSASPSARLSERMSDGLFKKKLQDLVKGLGSNNSIEQLSATRNVRELQASYPDRDYSIAVIPLMRIVKNEDANGPLRIAAARALHGTDSERGDFAIKGAASESKDKSVRRVCGLLSGERAKQDGQLQQELDREEALAKH